MARKYWPLAVIFVSRLWAFHAFPLSAEDAYISFHAALNPEWMKATTSPLWALFLSISDPQALARGTSLICDLATAYVVARYFTPWGAALWTAFWCSPFMIGSAVSGLETHIVAEALVCGLAWPPAFAVACLRPDTTVVALLAAGRRWRWVTLGALVAGLAALILTGHLMPQTIGSKLAVYGVHWFKGWYWWHSEGLGWLEVAFLLGGLWGACKSKRWIYFAAATLPLCFHWALGTPNFWWYAVPPAAMLCALACKRLPRSGFVIGLALLVIAWSSQWSRLHARSVQEGALMRLALCLKDQHPNGTILLEPAGIIPYVNPNLRVVDDVGLAEPWMAQRRLGPPGWLTDAIAKYQPDYIVSRVVELESGQAFAGGGEPFRSSAERDTLLDHYWLGCTTGITFIGDKIHGRKRADVMVELSKQRPH